MLDLNRCLMSKTRELPIVPGTLVMEEGLPLVKVMVNGKEAVRVHTDSKADNPVFIGFSFSESLTPIIATTGIITTLDESGKAKMLHDLITGQITVYEIEKNQLTNEITRKKRFENGNVSIDGGDSRVITVTGGENKLVEIVYAYKPTVDDIIQNRDLKLTIPHITSSQMTGTTGVIMDGEVYTDKIDLSADFTAADAKLCVSTAGLLSTYTGGSPSGNAIAIPNAQIIEYPTANSPFVGIRILG